MLDVGVIMRKYTPNTSEESAKHLTSAINKNHKSSLSTLAVSTTLTGSQDQAGIVYMRILNCRYYSLQVYLADPSVLPGYLEAHWTTTASEHS